VSVAGNTFIAESVVDEVRGRVFTALESSFGWRCWLRWSSWPPSATL
jgi:hypothetical protein